MGPVRSGTRHKARGLLLFEATDEAGQDAGWIRGNQG